MPDPLSRRGLLIAGAALILDGCARRGSKRETAQASPPAATTFPPRARATDVPVWGSYHVVLPGETAASIAAANGIPLEHLLQANDLDHRDLHPGEKLWLPGVKSPTALRQPEPEDEGATDEVVRSGYVLVPRSRWTSRAVKGNNRPMGRVQRITIHHTDEHAGMVGLPDVEVIRRIENYHTGPEKRWAAIGYHYLVGKDGRVYEGRPVRYQGAHVLSENENNLGISVIGDFNRKLPSPRQLAALQSFLGDQRERFKVSLAHVYGHRDLNSSICPGDALYGWLKRYKSA